MNTYCAINDVPLSLECANHAESLRSSLRAGGPPPELASLSFPKSADLLERAAIALTKTDDSSSDYRQFFELRRSGPLKDSTLYGTFSEIGQARAALRAWQADEPKSAFRIVHVERKVIHETTVASAAALGGQYEFDAWRQS